MIIAMHVSMYEMLYLPSFLLHPTQLNQKLGKPYFPKINHKPQNRPPLYLSSYTTKLDQIQYATLFQPN